MMELLAVALVGRGRLGGMPAGLVSGLLWVKIYCTSAVSMVAFVFVHGARILCGSTTWRTWGRTMLTHVFLVLDCESRPTSRHKPLAWLPTAVCLSLRLLRRGCLLWC